MPDNSPAACPLPPQLRARYAAFWERTELDRPILFFTAPAQERPPPHPDDQRPAAVQRAMRRLVGVLERDQRHHRRISARPCRLTGRVLAGPHGSP